MNEATGIDYDVCIRKILQSDRLALEELYRDFRDFILWGSFLL